MLFVKLATSLAPHLSYVFFEDEVERFKTKNSSVRRVASPHHAPVNVEETNAPPVFFSNTEAERNDW